MNDPMGKRVSVTFVGPILYPATKNLRTFCCQVANSKADEIRLQISSTGGSLFEGFALYHFLRSLPLKVTTHNIGNIDSIANIVFLAGEIRRACSEGRFLLHEFDWAYSSAQSETHSRLKEHAASLDDEKARYASILKSRIDPVKSEPAIADLLSSASILSAQRARELGLVHEVAEPSCKDCDSFWNIDY